MAAPFGWVSPQWQSLSRRPMFLGLPAGAAFLLSLLFVYVIVVLRIIIPGLIVLCGVWIICAAITRYDPYGLETLFAQIRMPLRLKVA
jgi:type IV secretory pathway VirB3-like protein